MEEIESVKAEEESRLERMKEAENEP
jgi:hypothetical protein